MTSPDSQPRFLERWLRWTRPADWSDDIIRELDEIAHLLVYPNRPVISSSQNIWLLPPVVAVFFLRLVMATHVANLVVARNASRVAGSDRRSNARKRALRTDASPARSSFARSRRA